MDATLIQWPSPAKLNLFLHITGRREDGYHELQSLFQLLDYGDTMSFEVNNSGDISIDSNYDIPLTDNIVYKAAVLLQTETKTTLGCHIKLHKILPTGGGLGGGSSNAATALLALNHYWQLNMTSAQLQQLGLQLGADVPIFVNGHTAFAEGVGEKLTNTSLTAKFYLVVNPCVHIATASIFNHPDLPRATPYISHSEYHFSHTKNDCEALVCNQYPDIANTLHRLLEYAPSRMTGTGACLFSGFDSHAQAQLVAEQLPKHLQWFIAQGVNESPVLKLLKEQ